MRGLNLDQLKTFSEVVAQGSFSAAARRLNLSQPAVSLQVRELESRMGLRLVERLGKRAFPTEAGRELLEHAERLQADADEAFAAMRRHQEGWLGRVRIGTGTAVLTYLLPPILARLRVEHPNVEIVIIAGTSARMVERCLANEVDLGLVALPVTARALDVVPVREDALLAVLPASARDAPRRVDAATLARHPLIVDSNQSQVAQLVRDWFAHAGVRARPAMELGNIEAIKNVVAAGLGAAVLPGEALSVDPPLGHVEVRALDPPLSRTLALIQRLDKPQSASLRIVREALLGVSKVRGYAPRQGARGASKR